jgi:hypothetical protein
MTNIHMSFHRELNCANKQRRAAVTPVINSSLTKAAVPSIMPDATRHFDLMAAALEYEVICPNCARVELASTSDMVKHLCNCGYGVYVEMLRTSPN